MITSSAAVNGSAEDGLESNGHCNDTEDAQVTEEWGVEVRTVQYLSSHIQAECPLFASSASTEAPIRGQGAGFINNYTRGV